MGIFQSIWPIIKYQVGKANVVANALTKGERKNVKDSTIDLAVATTIEEQVLALSCVGVELTVEEL